MSDSINEDDLKKILECLYKLSLDHHNNYAYTTDIASVTKLSIDDVNHICNHAKIIGWVNAVDYTTSGTWSMQITQGGLSKLESLKQATSKKDDTISEIKIKKKRTMSKRNLLFVIAGIITIITGILYVVEFTEKQFDNQNASRTPIMTNITSSNIAINTTSSNIAQSTHQSGGVTATSIINSSIYEGRSQSSPNLALVNITDVSNEGKILLPIDIKNQDDYKGKILLFGEIPNDGMMYTKLLKVKLPPYNDSLFHLTWTNLTQPVSPQQAHHDLNLIIPFDMIVIPSPSSEYTNRNDTSQYELNGGNAIFQFTYESVENDHHVWNFTEPLSIMVKGCIDDHNKDTPCKKQQPYQSPTPVQESISVHTDKPSYNNSEMLTVQGVVNSLIPNQFVIIQIKNDHGDLIFTRSTIPNVNGNYIKQIHLGTQIDGNYMVLVNYGTAQNQTTFMYISH